MADWKKLKKSDPKFWSEISKAWKSLEAQEKKLSDAAEAKHKEIRELRDFLVENFSESDLKGVSTKYGKVRLVTKVIPVAATSSDPEAWNKIYAFIKKTDSFDLLQRRLHEGAVKARWDDGQQIPGVVQFIKKDVKLGDAE